MSTTTTRLGLYKPASDGSELVNVVTDLNNNYDALDLAVGFRVVTSSTRPSSPYGGQGILESDTSYRSYLNNGTAPASGGWIEIPNGSATYGSQLWASRSTDATTLRAANTVGGGNTNPAILTEHAAAAGIAYGARVSGDTQDRVRIRADGRIDIGPGTGARDTNLYRSAADTLKTDDSLIVGSTLAVTGAATIGSTLTVGGGLSLAGDLIVAGIGQVQNAFRTSDLSRSSTTTTSADTQLTLPVVSGAKYRLSAVLFYGARDDTDLKFGWGAPGSSSLTWHGHCQATSTSGTSGSAIYDAQTISTTGYAPGGAAANNTTIMVCLVHGFLVAGGSGSLTLNWAQNTSNGTATVMKADSYIELLRVA